MRENKSPKRHAEGRWAEDGKAGPIPGRSLEVPLKPIQPSERVDLRRGLHALGLSLR